nr:NACHT domain-containing protein [Roseofilum halophilum]
MTLTGLSGIGKTALARQLVEDIKDNFELTLWCSHRQFPTLNTLKTTLLEFLASSSSNQNPVILESLRNHPCLIILDDFHETLTPGEFVSNYRPEYQTYGQLLQDIGQLPHNSCLVLISWEQPLEIATLETENPYCKTFPVPGLGNLATQLLQQRQLKDPKRWLDLIQIYNGNPLWLKIIAATILDLFNGSVQQFLSYPTLFLGDLEPILKQHYQRISESEKILLHWLANQEQPVEISQKPPELLSDADFLKAIQSLHKRSLLEKSSVLTLQPAIKQYVKNQIP